MRRTEADYKEEPYPWENVGAPPTFEKPYTYNSAMETMIHYLNLPFLENRIPKLVLELGNQGWTNAMITKLENESWRNSNWNTNKYIKERLEGDGKKVLQMGGGFGG